MRKIYHWFIRNYWHHYCGNHIGIRINVSKITAWSKYGVPIFIGPDELEPVFIGQCEICKEWIILK